MPTVVTTTIAATSSPTTPDYTTLQAWEDDLPANLVSADEQHVGECLDQGEFTGSTNLLDISGHTTDATRNIVLRCATGASFSDNANVRSNALEYNSSNGVAITSTQSYATTISVNTAYTVLEGLQIRANGFNPDGVLRLDSSDITVSRCILAKTPSFGNYVISINGGAAGAIIKNCLIYVSTGNSAVRSQNYTTQAALYGCTIIKTGSAGGIALNYGTGTTNGIIQDCAIFNFSTMSSGSFSASSGYNATDLASAPGSNNQTSLTFADQFENTSTDFRAVATGDLQAGIPNSTYIPDDISGETRDATTIWIGCWEVAAAPGGTAVFNAAWCINTNKFQGIGRTP